MSFATWKSTASSSSPLAGGGRIFQNLNVARSGKVRDGPHRHSASGQRNAKSVPQGAPPCDPCSDGSCRQNLQPFPRQCRVLQHGILRIWSGNCGERRPSRVGADLCDVHRRGPIRNHNPSGYCRPGPEEYGMRSRFTSLHIQRSRSMRMRERTIRPPQRGTGSLISTKYKKFLRIGRSYGGCTSLQQE